MIVDTLAHAHRYLPLSQGFKKAFDFLNRPDLKDLPVDRHAIEDDLIFAIVAREPGRKKADAQLETHEKYIDIQMVLEGIDNMGWKPKSSCQSPAGEYDPERDLQFFKDGPDILVPVKPGMYAIFFPEDAHMPLISDSQIHKVIVKIAVKR